MPDQDIGSGQRAGISAVVDASLFTLETSTPLAAGATFTGPLRDTLIYNWFAVQAFSDVAGTLFVDESEASSAQPIFQVATQASGAVPATHGSPGTQATGQTARLGPVKNLLRWVRAVYVNGGTIQATFRLNTSLSPLN